MITPAAQVHDITINVTGNCNDCCDNDKCSCCCCFPRKVTPKVSPVNHEMKEQEKVTDKVKEVKKKRFC